MTKYIISFTFKSGRKFITPPLGKWVINKWLNKEKSVVGVWVHIKTVKKQKEREE